MFHFIFDYNYGNFSQTLITFTILNRNEYSTKHVQIVSLQANYVSTLPGKTKNNTKTADRLLQCVRLNRLFQTFAESRSMFFNFSIC